MIIMTGLGTSNNKIIMTGLGTSNNKIIMTGLGTSNNKIIMTRLGTSNNKIIMTRLGSRLGNNHDQTWELTMESQRSAFCGGMLGMHTQCMLFRGHLGRVALHCVLGGRAAHVPYAALGGRAALCDGPKCVDGSPECTTRPGLN